MSSSMEFARESVDEQAPADPQQFETNFVCGPKPLVMALKYLRYGCVGGWSAQTVTTVVLGFLPTLHQRAIRKREKMNAQGTLWLPTIMPALRALDVELQSHAELSLAVSPLLSKILHGSGENLGNFICIFITALQKVPFSVQQKVILPATETMLANHSDVLINLFASDSLSAGPLANVMANVMSPSPTRFVLTPSELKHGMKVHFKCMGIQSSSKAQNLRVRQDGHVEGNGCFGARATWIVGLVGEHDGAPVVTLHADMKDQSCYLHLSEDGTVDGSGAGGLDCEFLVVSEGGFFVGLQSRSKPSLRLRIAETGTNNADVQFHFAMLLAAPLAAPAKQQIIKSIAGRFAKQIKLHESDLMTKNSQRVEASSRDGSLPRMARVHDPTFPLPRIASSDLKDGLQVHFICMSMPDEKARNLRVGEDGCLEGCGGCGARATWTVGLVGRHEDVPVVTLRVLVRGQVFYLRVTEDGKIDGRGTGDSTCHFIVRTHDNSCVELHGLTRPSVKVRIGASGQALEPENTCEDSLQCRFTILSAQSEKAAWRKVVPGEVLGKIKQAIGGASALNKWKLIPEEIRNGMKVHLCCLGRSGSENRNLRVRPDGDVEGRGGFGLRATWTVHAVDQHKGAVVFALRAHIDGQSWYLHAADNGTKIDGRGTGGPDCLFTASALGQDGTVGLHSVMWPAAKVTVGTCGKSLDPLSETPCANQAFKLLRALNAAPRTVAQLYVQPSAEVLEFVVPNGDVKNSPSMTANDLKDGLQVHFKCTSVRNKKASNLRVGEGGCLEGHGGCGPRATWTVSLVGEHGGSPVVTLQALIKGHVSYLHVAEDGKKIDGLGMGDSSCHFIVTTQGDSCVGLRWLARPSVRVRIGSSGQALDPLAGCETCDVEHFSILPVATTGQTLKIQPTVIRHAVAKTKQLVGKLQQAQTRTHTSTLLISNLEKIQDGMKVHLMSLGSSSDNQNLRVRSDGDAEGRGAFGARATWIVGIIGEHRGGVAVTLRVLIEGKSSYLRAADGGTRIDCRGTGDSDCHFVMTMSGVEDGVVSLHSILWPGARVMVGPCGKLLDPLSSAACDKKNFKLLRAPSWASAAAESSVPQPVGSTHDKILAPNSLKDGLQVHLRCMSMQHNKARNLRVAEDGGLEGHGGYGARATWTVGVVGNHEGAPVITLFFHIKGQKSYLHVAEDGKRIDGEGMGDWSCHFIASTQGDSCVGLRCLAKPSVRVRIGSSGQALDPLTDCDDASAQFTLLSVVRQDPARTMVHAARSIGQAYVKSKLFDWKSQPPLLQGSNPKELPIKPNPTSSPLAHSIPDKRLEVLTAHTLCDGLRVHLQCNGRWGAQRKNLRLCASGDVEGLGMFGHPATWTLNVIGKHNCYPIVTLRSELQGVPHFLRATKQGQKIDGGGQGGVDCQFMVKTLHIPSSVGLHPVVSPLARLGVGADGKLLDPFEPETDQQFSFSFLLSRHSVSSDWQLIKETKIPEGNGEDEPTKLTDKAFQEDWRVMDSKEGQSGDDW